MEKFAPVFLPDDGQRYVYLIGSVEIKLRLNTYINSTLIIRVNIYRPFDWQHLGCSSVPNVTQIDIKLTKKTSCANSSKLVQHGFVVHSIPLQYLLMLVDTLIH